MQRYHPQFPSSPLSGDDPLDAVWPVILSAAGFFILPGLEAISFYLPLFSMDATKLRFGEFSLLGLVAVLLSVPAPILAGFVYAGRRRSHRPRTFALIGLCLGVLAMLEITMLYLSVHTHTFLK